MNIKNFTFNPFSENCYIISNKRKEAIIIDPGCCSLYEQSQLKKYLDENGLKIRLLLNTHLHLDHILGNKYIYQNYGIGAKGNPRDNFLIENAKEYAYMFGLMNTAFDEDFFDKALAPMPLDSKIDEGDVLEIEDVKLHVFSIPGHTPGHLIFYSSEEGVLFSGDCLFRHSIGRTDLAGGDPQVCQNQLIDAIKHKILPLPSETYILPGHGPYTTIREEKDNNPYLRNDIDDIGL